MIIEGIKSIVVIVLRTSYFPNFSKCFDIIPPLIEWMICGLLPDIILLTLCDSIGEPF